MPLLPLQITEGVQPSTDRTNLSTTHWTDANRVRFVDGLPFTFDDSATINGCPRTMFSHTIGTSKWMLIGTHTRLYSLLRTELTNLTPIDQLLVLIL